MIRQERTNGESPDAALKKNSIIFYILYFFLDIRSFYYFYDFKGQL